MPRLYSIPDWYGEEYEATMLAVVTAIERDFRDAAPVDEAYLDALQRSGQPEHLAHLEFWRSGAEPVWMGSCANVGVNVIRVRNASAFRRILPPYMAASILVPERGPLPAENTDMPMLLARRLRPPFMPGLFAECSPMQLATIRKVLELMATRDDAAGGAAGEALAKYWIDVEIPAGWPPA